MRNSRKKAILVNLYLLTGYEGNSKFIDPSIPTIPRISSQQVFYYTERDVRCKMMAEGKIIDVAVKTTSTGYNNNINRK